MKRGRDAECSWDADAPRRVGIVSGVARADVPVNAGRAALVDGLIASLDLKGIERIPASLCTWTNIELHHDSAYCEALARGEPDATFGLEFDGHPFPGLAEHCRGVAGATLSAADWLTRCAGPRHALAINWHGGRHHARSAEASGWCFVNDAVLAMLLLRKRGHQRLAYVDIDIHAGDGVEEACDEDTLYISTHLHETGFFPFPAGKECDSESPHIVNIPLKRGFCDSSFLALLEDAIIPRLVRHEPEVVILQLGADSLAGDPIGKYFNLTPLAHCALVSRVAALFPRVLCLGGGGYHHANTARCWAAATHAALGPCAPPLPEQVPDSCPHFELFGPDFVMRVRAGAHVKDENAKERCE
jgi:acetoin utilization deacetylase AcuC-like enzyme